MGAKTIVPRLARVFEERPDDLAVIADDAVLSFRQLEERADRLAAELRACGVKPGALVAQCVERSAALVVAGLAVLRAGGAFVAIDPRYPQARIHWMLEDAGVAAVVADAPTAEILGDAVPVVLASVGEVASGRPSDLPAITPPGPDDLAYVVYTSGSTGLPKGVLIEHASLMNLVHWHLRAFGLTAGDRTTQIASPGFDAAVWEIWPALVAGATILVVPDELRTDPARLRDWLLSKEIAISFIPTALAERLLELPWPTAGKLRYLLTGGDALGRRPPQELPFALVNNYGLSETTVVATSGLVAAGGDGRPSIGRPIDGVQAEVVDERFEPVAPGEQGELVLGGVALARGYLGRPDLTTERFRETPRGRRYLTGDRARWRQDGELEFLGRLDDQLSIRGFRVEPGEVSAALARHPDVSASAVVAAGDSSSDRRLVAYVVPATGAAPDPAELAAHAAASLPEYMVPSQWVLLDELPVTAHGKLDRAGLPEPDAVTPASDAPALDGARQTVNTTTEAEVAAIIADLLGTETVGSDENFFLIGGHSMLGAQLIVRLEERFGAEISLRHLFDHPTPAEIAAEVDRQRGRHAATEAVTG